MLTTLSDEGGLTLPDGVPTTVTVERPRQKEHGDYATNVALQLAKKAGLYPRDLATSVQAGLSAVDGIAKVEIAGPGFLNITVEAGAQGEVALAVVAAGAVYGGADLMAGENVNLEFVSANPTGPLHLGDVRCAAVGDALAPDPRGERRGREPGVLLQRRTAPQIDRFSGSLLASVRGLPRAGGRLRAASTSRRSRTRSWPSGPRSSACPTTRRRRSCGPRASRSMFDEVKKSLHDFGVDFDVYFHEASLHKTGAVARPWSDCAPTATPSRPTARSGSTPRQFGDDKDRVIIRSDGRPTYSVRRSRLLPRQAGAGLRPLPVMLGADHHGYVERMMGDRRRVRRRAGQEPRDPDRAVREPAQGRRAAADVQAGRHLARHRRPGRRDRGRCPRATRWPATAPTRAIDIDLELWARPTGPTPSTTCSTRTRGPPRC